MNLFFSHMQNLYDTLTRYARTFAAEGFIDRAISIENDDSSVSPFESDIGVVTQYSFSSTSIIHSTNNALGFRTTEQQLGIVDHYWQEHDFFAFLFLRKGNRFSKLPLPPSYVDYLPLISGSTQAKPVSILSESVKYDGDERATILRHSIWTPEACVWEYDYSLYEPRTLDQSEL